MRSICFEKNCSFNNKKINLNKVFLLLSEFCFANWLCVFLLYIFAIKIIRIIILDYLEEPI